MTYLKRIKWVFNPEEYTGIGHTHAQVPTPYILADRIRIFYAGRVSGISNIFSVDISPPPNFEVLSLSGSAVLMPSKNAGTFDDEGVMPSCIIQKEGIEYLFYSGWNSRNTIPYHNSTGIAKYNPSLNQIERIYDGPVMERTYQHPYLAVTPCVWRSADIYECLYISGLGWKKEIGKSYEPIYVVKKAYSDNLLDWQRPTEQHIPSEFALECFSNPTVNYDSNNQELDILFCSRNAFDFRVNSNNSYKIKYAKEKNGKVERLQIEWGGSSASKNELEMQCYPTFFKWGDKQYIVYNGNSFGKTGFGIAEFIK